MEEQLLMASEKGNLKQVQDIIQNGGTDINCKGIDPSKSFPTFVFAFFHDILIQNVEWNYKAIFFMRLL